MKTLEHSVKLEVRFSETDAMGVVWHGNYLKFFEDAREKFGEHFQMEYLDIYKNGYFTPIVTSEIQHKATVNYGEKISVKAVLQFHSAAKIIFTYEVQNETTGLLAAKGKTMQVFMRKESRELELIKPSFYEEWEKKQAWLVQ